MYRNKIIVCVFVPICILALFLPYCYLQVQHENRCQEIVEIFRNAESVRVAFNVSTDVVDENGFGVREERNHTIYSREDLDRVFSYVKNLKVNHRYTKNPFRIVESYDHIIPGYGAEIAVDVMTNENIEAKFLFNQVGLLYDSKGDEVFTLSEELWRYLYELPTE